MLWHGKNFRGIINKAKEMIFDNTGTNLQSTNAEDAIKEVNGNLTVQTLTNVATQTARFNISSQMGARQGNVIQFQIIGAITSSMTTYYGNIATLSMPPIANCQAICTVTVASAGAKMISAYAGLDTNGNIYLVFPKDYSLTTADTVQVAGTYITNS